MKQKILVTRKLSDDAEEKFDGSDVLTSSSDLEMMYDTFNDQGLQTIGLRFDDITIPSNATISNAYIQFTADGNNSGNLTIIIKGEDVANSSSFTDSSSFGISKAEFIDSFSLITSCSSFSAFAPFVTGLEIEFEKLKDCAEPLLEKSE